MRQKGTVCHAKPARAKNAQVIGYFLLQVEAKRLNWLIDDLLALLGPVTRATWVLALTGITGLAFALSAFACDRLGHKLIAPFLAAGAWLCAGFGALVWFWRCPQKGRSAAGLNTKTK